MGPNIPRRKVKFVKAQLKDLKFCYTATTTEASIIAQLQGCKNLSDLVALKTRLFNISDPSEGSEYIRTALNHM